MLREWQQGSTPALSLHVGVRADIDVFMGIERSAFAQDRISRAEYDELAESKDAAMLLARFHGSAIGAMVLKRQHEVEGSVAYLYSLAVVPGFRKIGIGRALLSRAIALSKTWNVQRLCLEVRPDNHAALDLYGSAGFVTTGTREDWYSDGAPAICMVRDFAADLAGPPFNNTVQPMMVNL